MALDDTNLLVRYYFDEAASGTAPTAVEDASGNNYDLTTIVYDGGGGNSAAYTEVSGNRGIDINSANGADGTQRALRVMDIDTPDDFSAAIDAGQKFTVEVVLIIDSYSGNNSRLFCINDAVGNAPRIGFSAYGGQTGPLRMWFYDGTTSAYTGVAVPSGRVVIHGVVDTTQTTATDRIKIYVNGTLQTVLDQVAPGQDTTGSFGTGGAVHHLIAFNRESSGSWNRSFDGILYYGAIYDDAFSSTRVTDHYNVLTADDDTPAASVLGSRLSLFSAQPMLRGPF